MCFPTCYLLVFFVRSPPIVKHQATRVLPYIIEDGSGGGEGGRGVSSDGEGGSCGEEASGGVDGGSGGVDKAARLRGVGAAPVASTAHGSGGVDVGKRRRRSGATANWGDGGEGEGFGEEVVTGGGGKPLFK